MVILTLEEGKHRDNTSRRDIDGELILPDGELLHVFGHAAHQPGAVSVHVVGFALVLVGRVDKRRLELSNVISGCLPRVWRIFGHHNQIWGGGRKGADKLRIAAGQRLLRWPQS